MGFGEEALRVWIRKRLGRWDGSVYVHIQNSSDARGNKGWVLARDEVDRPGFGGPLLNITCPAAAVVEDMALLLCTPTQ